MTKGDIMMEPISKVSGVFVTDRPSTFTILQTVMHTEPPHILVGLRQMCCPLIYNWLVHLLGAFILELRMMISGIDSL